ncbi:MAG: DNA repair protein RadC [Pseudomonadota bacterium]
MAPESEKSIRPPASAAKGSAGHRQRLRERFLKSGLDGFHDYEIIELLLTLGTPRKDCKPAAKAAMDHFGSLNGVLDAGGAALCQVPGLGPQNILGIKLITAVADRYLAQRLMGRPVLGNSRELYDYLVHLLQGKDRECFMAVFLDAKNQVTGTDLLFEGTLTASAVYPREVVKNALERKAAAVIFAHNHPSQVPDPSPEDVAITRRLVFACRLLDIRVHEHIVIGGHRYYSFADNGIISTMHADFERKLMD